MTKALVVQCWLSLLRTDMRLRVQGYPSVRKFLMSRKPPRSPPLHSSGELSQAMDLASVFYFRRISPLLRAVCHTLLLRDHGWPAELVIGLQLLPMEPYAWVEVDGAPVNERAGALDTYQVLDRC